MSAINEETGHVHYRPMEFWVEEGGPGAGPKEVERALNSRLEEILSAGHDVIRAGIWAETLPDSRIAWLAQVVSAKPCPGCKAEAAGLPAGEQLADGGFFAKWLEGLDSDDKFIKP